MRSNRLFAVLVLAGMVFFGLSDGLWAQAPPVPAPAKSVQQDLPDIHVNLRESMIFRPPWDVIRVSVTDPEIVDVKILQPGQLLIQGKGIGSTDLIVWSEDERNILRAKVYVDGNLELIKRDLLGLFPDAQLEIAQTQDMIVLKGQLRRVEDATQLRQFMNTAKLKYVDMTSVAGVQQVQIKIRVAEVSRVAIKAMGINFLQTGSSFFGGSTIGSANGGPLNPVSVGAPQGPIANGNVNFTNAVQVNPSVTLFGGVPGADLEFFIQALAENQYVRIMANPTLVALSGEEASFLAGGEFPIPVVQGSTTGGGTSITVEYKEFGVRLAFRPIVLGDNTIRLFVAPEVSELSDTGAVEIQGFRIPSVLTRKSMTTLELHSGQTFALAGLIRRNLGIRNSRVPGIGDIPVLGNLFRSSRYQNEETELVIMVSADLVEPMNQPNDTPVPGIGFNPPNDWEFYLGGRMDNQLPAPIAPKDANFLRQAGLDQLYGPGAWASYENQPGLSQAEYRPAPENVPAEPAPAAPAPAEPAPAAEK